MRNHIVMLTLSMLIIIVISGCVTEIEQTNIIYCPVFEGTTESYCTGWDSWGTWQWPCEEGDNIPVFELKGLPNGWEIAESKMREVYLSLSLTHCEIGKDVGQNENYFYCRPTYLEKKNIVEDGTILSIDRLIVNFVFDRHGELVSYECLGSW